MKADKHISELLYEHDCVIVPELGGFVANYTSAKIHPTQHTFTTPSKNIVFNKNLKNNDGLLANRIASAEKVNYQDAIKYISMFSSGVNAKLKKGEKVLLQEIGTLYLDIERNIQFEAGTTNYLSEAYGLTSFHSPPIKLDTIGKRLEKEFKDRGAIPSEKKNPVRAGNIKRYVALAVALPFIFAMIWIPLKTDLLKNINSSSLNPFSSKDIVAEKIELNPTSVAEAKPLLPDTKDTSKQKGLVFSVSSAQPVTAQLMDSKTPETVKIDSTNVSVNDVHENLFFKFHLVTGCFQIRENADKFITDLQNQNIRASIIGKRGGLYVVSAGEYETRKEAFSQLMQLRKNQPDAWLLKKEF